MGRFGCWLGPFWSCFFFHWGRFGRGRFGLRGPFSTFIRAVLAMGRFGRFLRGEFLEQFLRNFTVTGVKDVDIRPATSIVMVLLSLPFVIKCMYLFQGTHSPKLLNRFG